MKNKTRNRRIRRLVGFIIILTGIGLMIGGAVSSNMVIGSVGFGIVKIGGMVIKIELIIKLISKIRRKKPATIVISEQTVSQVNETSNIEKDTALVISANSDELIIEQFNNETKILDCAACNARIGAGTFCAFCGSSIALA